MLLGSEGKSLSLMVENWMTSLTLEKVTLAHSSYVKGEAEFSELIKTIYLSFSQLFI